MALRRSVILVLVLLGGVVSILGTPTDRRAWATGAFLFGLAYVYAQLTRPKDRL